MTRFGSRHLIMAFVLVGLACLTSCSDTQRHRALSFFFDGVPPLSGQVVEEASADNNTNAPRKRVEPAWFLHEPQANCVRCHGTQKQANFSRQVNLVSAVPDLCYECHAMPSPQQGWVHGPVASGQCVLCHEPHRSLNQHLLKKPEPQLCFQCHEEVTLRTVAGHQQATYETCLDCHAGHQSFAKNMLRESSVVSNARQGRTEPTGDPRFDALVASARSEIQASQGLANALRIVAQYIGSSDLIQARATLMAIRLDTAYSAQERDQVIDLQARIEKAEKTVSVQQQADRRERAEVMAQVYYDSVSRYRSGRLQEAKTGFERLLNSDVVPATIKQAIKQYLVDINQRLANEMTYR